MSQPIQSEAHLTTFEAISMIVGNDQVQDHVHTIGDQYHPHDIQHAVLRGKIRNGDDAGTDAVADDHADGFKGRVDGIDRLLCERDPAPDHCRAVLQ